MYCSTCGSQISDKLNYCKNCGAKIAKDGEDETPKSMMSNLLTALTLVVLGGFGILVGLVAVLLQNGFEQKGIAIIAVFYLAALTGICFMLLGQLPKLVDAKLKLKQDAPESYQPPQIFAQNVAQLEQYREPAVSITEHTTRNFEKAPRREN